jgi:Domain of unknown function (DUF5667)
MTPLFPAQRAAEEFERVLSGTADDAVAARYAELRDAVQQLRTLPEVTPRAEFVGDLRSRLMAAAETELVAVPKATLRAVPSLPEERTKRRNRRIGTIAASLVVVGGTAGMAAAASGALPGETLYPIKRGIEQVTTAAHFGDAAQGRALLGQAATRLEEVRALQAEGNADPDVISQTMDAFRTAADSGSEKLFSSYQSSGDQADITAVRDFTAAQMADVAAMSAGADTATNDLLVDAADTLADIDAQARNLCGACAPTKPLASPNALSAGAGAATVANLLASPVSQVKTEAATIAAARAARIKALRANAESQASKFPLLPAGTNPDGTPNYSFPGTPGSAENPITNVITPDGKLLPTVTSGAAVTNLVSGVTGTLSTVTNGATDPVTKPLDDATKKLGDAVGDTLGKATDGLTP